MTCVEASELMAANAAMGDDELAALGRMTRPQQALAEANRGLAGEAARLIHTDLMDFEEKMAAGYLGVCRATVLFDPGKGVKFSTYATICAKSAIYTEIKRLHTNKNTAHRISLCDPHDLEESVESRPDEPPNPDFARNLRLVEAAIDRLPERERSILRRLSRDETLGSIGADLGLSKERVRQLHAKARQHVRRTLREGGCDLSYGQVIDDATLRRRIEAARRAKAEAHGASLSAEACDAIFGAEGEMNSRRLPEVPAGFRRCTRCRKSIPPGGYYATPNDRGSLWCGTCERDADRRRSAKAATRRGGRTP